MCLVHLPSFQPVFTADEGNMHDSRNFFMSVKCLVEILSHVKFLCVHVHSQSLQCSYRNCLVARGAEAWILCSQQPFVLMVTAHARRVLL
jgi:hypothetical protein